MASLQGLPLCRGVNAIGEVKEGRGGYFNKNVHVAFITQYKDLRDFLLGEKKNQTGDLKVDFQSTGFERKILEMREHSISVNCVLKTNFSFCDFCCVSVKFIQLKLAMFLCLNAGFSQNFLEAILSQA